MYVNLYTFWVVCIISCTIGWWAGKQIMAFNWTVVFTGPNC